MLNIHKCTVFIIDAFIDWHFGCQPGTLLDVDYPVTGLSSYVLFVMLLCVYSTVMYRVSSSLCTIYCCIVVVFHSCKRSLQSLWWTRQRGRSSTGKCLWYEINRKSHWNIRCKGKAHWLQPYRMNTEHIIKAPKYYAYFILPFPCLFGSNYQFVFLVLSVSCFTVCLMCAVCCVVCTIAFVLPMCFSPLHVAAFDLFRDEDGNMIHASNHKI